VNLHRPVLLLVLVVTLLGAACSASGGPAGRFQGAELPEPQTKPELVLTDTDGEPFDLRAETEDQVTVLFFGYTSCPDICPLQMANLAGALEQNRGVNAHVVFVSVDPEVDTPEVIREWLDRYDVDFDGLTGTPEELRAAQEDALLPVATAATVEDDGTRTVGHAAQAIGFGRDGKAYVYWPSGTRQSTFAHDLAVLADIAPTPAP
jgi:protein SCO1/2